MSSLQRLTADGSPYLCRVITDFRMIRIFSILSLLLCGAHAADRWVPANEPGVVQASGSWQWTSHRYAAESAMVTREDGAALEFGYEGYAVILALDTLTPPNYGAPELGQLEISIDGRSAGTVRPREAANEVAVFGVRNVAVTACASCTTRTAAWLARASAAFASWTNPTVTSGLSSAANTRRA
jgi:hypothetical protein